MLKSELEKDILFWKNRVREEVEKNKNLQQTIEHLDKVLVEKTLDIRNLNHTLTIQNGRVDALLTCVVSLQVDLRASQSQYVFKPENENRFEFKNGKWRIKETNDGVSLAG